MPSVSEEQAAARAATGRAAVKVENLSVTYRANYESRPTLRTTLIRAGRGQRRIREIRAVQDISFEVPPRLHRLIELNPLTPIFATLSDVANRGLNPNPTYLAWGLAWALVAFVAGALFFMSREREFAVRL